MNIHRVYTLACVTCFLLALGFADVRSQTADANIREAIARNAELLTQARELVSETNSVKARASLEAAVKFHQESVFHLQQGGASLARAAQLAKHARETILQTIALAKREAKREEGAFKAIERATGRLEQARRLLADNRDRETLPSQKLLEEAHGLLRRARDNMREHLFEVALRLAVSSEQLSARAISLARRDFSDFESIENELEKTDRVHERVAEQLDRGAAPAARKMFEDAQDLQRRAKNRYRNDNPRLALDLTRRSRNVAMRALKMLASRADRENVEQAIHLTDMLVIEAGEILARRDAGRLQRRLEQAEEFQREAKRRFERGNYERALSLTLRARKVLREVLGSIKKALNAPEVRQALVETDEFLTRLREMVETADEESAVELYSRARANQEQAWREFHNQRLRAALAHTRLSRKLARGALRRLRNDDL